MNKIRGYSTCNGARKFILQGRILHIVKLKLLCNKYLGKLRFAYLATQKEGTPPWLVKITEVFYFEMQKIMGV
jgi:hypothetical protein